MVTSKQNKQAESRAAKPLVADSMSRRAFGQALVAGAAVASAGCTSRLLGGKDSSASSEVEPARSDSELGLDAGPNVDAGPRADAGPSADATPSVDVAPSVDATSIADIGDGSDSVKPPVPNIPGSGKWYFVAPNGKDGKDGHDGSTENKAFGSIQTALDLAQPGEVVWVKAGLYPKGQRLDTVRHGAKGKEIFVKGYTIVPGDNPSEVMDIDSSHDPNPAKFPVLQAIDPNSDTTVIGINVAHDYIVVTGLQSKDFTVGAVIRASAKHSKMQWVYGLTNGDRDRPDYYLGSGVQCTGTDCVLEDCFAINGTGEGIGLSGTRNKALRCKAISNDFIEINKPYNYNGIDYLFGISGYDHEMDDCEALQHDRMNTEHNGHGFNIRGTRVTIRRPKTVNCGESIRFDTGTATSGATDCKVYDVDIRCTAKTGWSNIGIMFEGRHPNGNFVKGGTVTQEPGAVTQYAIRYQTDDNLPADLAGGQDNFVEGVVFNNNGVNISHRWSAGVSRKQTIRKCVFNGSAPLFQIEHTVEANCLLHDCEINLPELATGDLNLLKMSISAGSFSGDGSKHNTNNMAQAGFTLPG